MVRTEKTADCRAEMREIFRLTLLTLLSLHCVAAQSIAGQELSVTTAQVGRERERKGCNEKRENISQHEPWLHLKDDSASRVGNDRFEGFVMDLLHHLENKTGARFEVEYNRERERQ